jgi:hypothetical protein
MPYALGTTTTVYKTADSAIGTSGARIRVFSASWLSDGTARALVLRNGTADTDQIYVNAAGTISTTVTLNFGREGMVFGSGCFLDFTASMVNALITYRVES